MFKRRWKWFGPVISAEGFSLSYSYNTVLYTDQRGTFAFGLEDGSLSPAPFQVKGEPLRMDQTTVEEMIDRIVRGLRFDGHTVEVLRPASK